MIHDGKHGACDECLEEVARHFERHCYKCGKPATTDDEGDPMCEPCWRALGEIDDENAHYI